MHISADRTRMPLNHAEMITDGTHLCKYVSIHGNCYWEWKLNFILLVDRDFCFWMCSECYEKLVSFLLYWYRISIPKNVSHLQLKTWMYSWLEGGRGFEIDDLVWYGMVWHSGPSIRSVGKRRLLVWICMSDAAPQWTTCSQKKSRLPSNKAGFLTPRNHSPSFSLLLLLQPSFTFVSHLFLFCYCRLYKAVTSICK